MTNSQSRRRTLCGAAGVGAVLAAVALQVSCTARSDLSPRSTAAPVESSAVESSAVESRAREVPASPAENPSTTAISRTLSLGTFGRRPAVEEEGESSTCHICELRGELPAPRSAGPLPQPAAELLGRAAEALSRQDSAAALRLAEEAARVAPSHGEPLEVLLMAQHSRGVAGD